MVLLHEMIHADMMLQGGVGAPPAQHDRTPPAGHCRTCIVLAAERHSCILVYPHWPAAFSTPLPAPPAARRPCRLTTCLAWPAGIRDDDPGGHGTRFKAAMGAINASTAPDHQRPAAGCARADTVPAQCCRVVLHVLLMRRPSAPAAPATATAPALPPPLPLPLPLPAGMASSPPTALSLPLPHLASTPQVWHHHHPQHVC